MGWVRLSYFLIFHCLLLHFPSYNCLLCNPRDKSALLQFKNSFLTNISSYVALFTEDLCSSYSSNMKSWNNLTDCCGWDGVTCDIRSGYVIGLNFSCIDLRGELLGPNSSIFSLRHLQQLTIAFSDFSGSSIHSTIGDLVNLTHLTLLNFGMTGDVPSTISHLSKLEYLLIGSINSLLNDPIKSYSKMRLDDYTWNRLIHNATNLREIYLDEVNMSSVGESSLSLLTNLSSSLLSLVLYDTQIKGKLPTAILRLPNLQEIDLSFNENVRGELPNSNWTTPLIILILRHTAFSGYIPDSIGHLKSLYILQLNSCNFHGFIPPSLFNLTQLSHLDLSNNKLVGPIPTQITTLSELLILNLNDNILNGSIPRWCYFLPSLSFLYLRNNQFTGSIGEFSTNSLQYLSLSNNKLQGNFPNSIFQLQNLTFLNLSSNDLSGVVDFHQFSKLKTIFYLDLSHNSLLSLKFENNFDCILPNLQYLFLSSSNVSSFPKFIAPNLEDLDLSHNRIRGSIPKWFHENLLRSSKNIRYIDLSFNKLRGDLPIPPNGLEIFLVSNNELSGNISLAMCNASTLFILNLAHNNLTGLIPQCLATFPSLSVLDLQNNNLYGSIPDNFSKGNSFETLKLNGNQLKGPLPRSLAHCTNLEVLDLGNNNIEDMFPHWLEILTTLQVLSLRSNKFHGVITSFDTKLPFSRLRIFDISGNYFTGPLPVSYIHNFQGMMNANDNQTGLKYLGENSLYNDSIVIVMKGIYIELTRILTVFTSIDLSNNMFEGEIPKVIGELHSLKGLNLSHNRITGTIPLSLGNLSNLEWLDLSCNQLKGEIPMTLTNLNFLSVLNLSKNQLEGMIPMGGQFNTFDNISYVGNLMLCGLPLSRSCKGNKEMLQHSTFDEESGFEWKAVVIGYGCGTIFGIILGYNVFFSGKPQWLTRLVEVVFNVRLPRTNNRKHVISLGRS
ncbi:receptor-like protein 12 [Vigna radiata var. radiata]|uniref:Receptor-like protein 12 n=1 Tax=Vigna radiata var. radiata TaxID=3916 RepID=A0A1S3UD89_VIGRR|nr:receptor-like protein 12 [Vigna radiata var. radiata]